MAEEVKEKYGSIIKLHEMLAESGIRHDFGPFFGGYTVSYPSDKDWYRTMEQYSRSKIRYLELARFSCNAAEHDFTYGRSIDKIELMGMLTEDEYAADDVVVLDFEEVFNRIVEVEKKRKEGDVE